MSGRRDAKECSECGQLLALVRIDGVVPWWQCLGPGQHKFEDKAGEPGRRLP